jgi:hypothetical protein
MHNEVIKVECPCDWPPPPALTPDEERRLDDMKYMGQILSRDPSDILHRARLHVTDKSERGWSDWFAWGILQKAAEFERVINPPRVGVKPLPWD